MKPASVLAWRDNPALKTRAVSLARAADPHQSLPRILLDGSKAVSVARFHMLEREWGLDHALSAIIDHLAGHVPVSGGMPLAALLATPVGGDLEHVARRWLVDLLSDPHNGVGRHAREHSQRVAIGHVVWLHRRFLAGERVWPSQWERVRDQVAGAPFGDPATERAIDAAWDGARGPYARWVSVSNAVAEAELLAAKLSTSDDHVELGQAILRRSYRWQSRRLIHRLAEAPCPRQPQPENREPHVVDRPAWVVTPP